MVKTPNSVDLASFDTFVLALVALMLAPGMTAPLGSVTMPVNVARKSWANALVMSIASAVTLQKDLIF